MNFLVTDVVQQHRGAALTAFGARDQVMEALRRAFGNRAQAEGANRGHFGRSLCSFDTAWPSA